MIAFYVVYQWPESWACQELPQDTGAASYVLLVQYPDVHEERDRGVKDVSQSCASVILNKYEKEMRRSGVCTGLLENQDAVVHINDMGFCLLQLALFRYAQ